MTTSKTISTIIEDWKKKGASSLVLIQLKNTNNFFGHASVYDKRLLTNKSERLNYKKVILDLFPVITKSFKDEQTTLNVKGIKTYYNKYNLLQNNMSIEIYLYDKRKNINIFKGG